MKIKLSRSQWNQIGKETGWLKLGQTAPVAPTPPQAAAQANPAYGHAVGQNYSKLTQTLDKLLEDTFNKRTPKSLCEIPNFCVQGNVPRIAMPNFFSAKQVEDFANHLKQNGISVQNIPSIDPETAWNSQTNVVTDIIARYAGWDSKKSEEENIATFAARPPRINGDPVLISKEGYILDGHHRWAYAKAYNALVPGKKGASNFGPVIKVDMPIIDLIKFGLSSPMAGRKTDNDDSIMPGDQSKGIKWTVIAQGDKPVQNAYIDMQNQYIVNGQVAGVFKDQGHTGIVLNEQKVATPVQPAPQVVPQASQPAQSAPVAQPAQPVQVPQQKAAKVTLITHSLYTTT